MRLLQRRDAKQFNVPSARKLKTNQHVESFQPQPSWARSSTTRSDRAMGCICNNMAKRLRACVTPTLLLMPRLVFVCVLFTQGVGVLLSLLPTSLCRARVDGPVCPPTDTKDHTNLKSVPPNLAVWPPHVCHRQRDWPSPHARTCSRTWSFLKRLQV